MPRILSLNIKTCKYEPVEWVDLRYKKPRVSTKKHSYKRNTGVAGAKYLLYFCGILFLLAAVAALTK